jgi:hypothetical protein
MKIYLRGNIMDMKLLEKKVYTSFYKDGTLDLKVSAFFIYFSLMIFVSRSTLDDFIGVILAIVPAILILIAVKLIKKRVTTPRMGTITFNQKRKKMIKSIVVVPALLIIIGIAVYFLLPNGNVELFRTILFGSVFFVAFSVIAYLTSTARLSIYGILGSIAFISGKLLERSIDSRYILPILMLTVSVISLFVGITMLITFIKTTPVKSLGDENGR